MSVTVTIPFEQIKEIVKQLSPSEVEELKAQLETIAKPEENVKDKLRELLLRGPVMDEEQLKEIKTNRERTNVASFGKNDEGASVRQSCKSNSGRD
jgi:seryl-tRNA synthetase